MVNLTVKKKKKREGGGHEKYEVTRSKRNRKY